jgi:Domain of unknown function (DUF4437)
VFVFGLRIRSPRTVKLGLTCLAIACTGGPAAVAEDGMVVVPREEARFVPLDPSDPGGTQGAVLWGDPAKGPSSMLMKTKKLAGELHYHTYDYDLVLIEGRMKHWGEKEQEAEVRPLGPGSYWHQPGLQPHGDSCLTDECLMFIKWEGKRDAMLANPPK